ncbi:MAG: hypothetical protein ACU0DK_06750 [Pseudooceanicola sp.]
MVGRLARRFALGAAAGFFAREFARFVVRRQAARADAVRNAGPEHMRNPPRSWDDVDEQNDESFPASDPPGNY